MLRGVLSVARAPWPRVAPACGPRSPLKHRQPSILVDRSLATGGSLFEASTGPAFFQLRLRADDNRGGSSRGKRGRGTTSTQMQRRGPDFRTCQNASELVDLAHRSLGSMSNRDMAAFWSLLPRLVHRRGDRDPNLDEKLSEVLGCSLDEIRGFSSRDLAQTSLGLAKTIGSLKKGNRRYSREDLRRVLRDLLADKDAQLFTIIHDAALPILHEFDARSLSNLIYSFGLVKYNPTEAVGNHIVTRSLDNFWPQALSNVVWAYATAGVPHPELLRKIGDHVAGLKSLDPFKPQELSNIAWAFATAGEPHPVLFKRIGDHVAGLDLDSFKSQSLSNIAWAFVTAGVLHPELFKKIGDNIAGSSSLDSFKPQALSNTAWTFASAEVSHPGLFKKIGDHVSGLCSLDSFKAQALSNTAWAFATAGVPHPELFKKIGRHVTGLGSLDSFKPQALSNTAWAFATAEIPHPELFKKIGDHIAGLGSLDSFKPQELSNTAWAYATARVFHSRLFERLSTGALVEREHFYVQEVANFLWACATVGHTEETLFSAFAPLIESKLEKCNEQDLTNIGWAYSVTNDASEGLFNECFVGACASKECEFSEENLFQLHQWQLWQRELGSELELPRSLKEKCRNSFLSANYSESKLQNDIVGELKATGLDLEKEILLGSGYRIDALVKVDNGRKVAIEVDGPSHFIQRRPAGRTTLKHRQVATLDCIEVMSVPYWEWNELKNSAAKQHYLRKKLGYETSSRYPARLPHLVAPVLLIKRLPGGRRILHLAFNGGRGVSTLEEREAEPPSGDAPGVGGTRPLGLGQNARPDSAAVALDILLGRRRVGPRGAAPPFPRRSLGLPEEGRPPAPPLRRRRLVALLLLLFLAADLVLPAVREQRPSELLPQHIWLDRVGPVAAAADLPHPCVEEAQDVRQVRAAHVVPRQGDADPAPVRAAVLVANVHDHVPPPVGHEEHVPGTGRALQRPPPRVRVGPPPDVLVPERKEPLPDRYGHADVVPRGARVDARRGDARGVEDPPLAPHDGSVPRVGAVGVYMEARAGPGQVFEIITWGNGMSVLSSSVCLAAFPENSPLGTHNEPLVVRPPRLAQQPEQVVRALLVPPDHHGQLSRSAPSKSSSSRGHLAANVRSKRYSGDSSAADSQ
ncbi:hypothetical protein THAOC_26672 [Thalassiosira oceanica]|uniref:RAP domain-containing protein n=1 Tax=Thalassiosira oceanica TaxID=159749 RepID=K0S4J4_THAOC|nr:hypothetical protein THAOC_26672 [Thalassiosira oceanica]|eukprot:EJK53812.1 hypothetical protein THAOC_26672 [Thalassiosira oceanica]